MAVQAYNTILWFAVAAALAFGAMLAPANAFGAPRASAPTATEAARHADLGTQAKGDRHVHDDGEPDERRAGHVHGDGAADHSHDKLGVLAGVAPVLASRGESWIRAAIPSVNPEGQHRLRRPPKANAAR